MTYAVYVDGEGYIGDVSAPSRVEAVRFLMGQGIDVENVELREVVE